MVVRLSALRAGRTFPPRKIPGAHFCYRLSRRQDHGATGRIRLIEKSNGPIGNRTRDLPASSIVTAYPRAGKSKHDMPRSVYVSLAFHPGTFRIRANLLLLIYPWIIDGLVSNCASYRVPWHAWRHYISTCLESLPDTMQRKKILIRATWFRA
jgi:hypothetical protein